MDKKIVAIFTFLTVSCGFLLAGYGLVIVKTLFELP